MAAELDGPAVQRILRVYRAILGEMQDGQTRPLKFAEIGKRVELPTWTTTEYIDRLISWGWLTYEYSPGGGYCYRLGSPEAGSYPR